MRRATLSIVLLSCPAVVSFAAGPEVVRVRVLESARPEQVTVFPEVDETPLRHAAASYRELVIAAAGAKVRVMDGAERVGVFSEFELDQGEGRIWVAAPESVSRLYAGKLRFSAEGGLLKVVNHVPLETYLVGLMQRDAGVVRHRESALAQSVVTRSYVAARMGRRHQGDYDFCDHEHCQVFPGLDGASMDTRRAVLITRGLVLAHKGEPIEAFAHLSCGGRTADAGEIWPGQGKPFLTSVVDAPADGDPYCSIAPDFRWEFVLDSLEFDRLARGLGWITGSRPVLRLDVLATAPSGRVKTIRLGGRGRRHRDLGGQAFYEGFGRAFGWFKLRSSWFDVERDGESWVFTGRGGGHGVGFCQWGAEGMARHGRKYREILEHYFPKAEIAQLER